MGNSLFATSGRQRPRGVLDAAVVIGNGEAREVVELQQARVVVAERNAERLREPHEQERFGGAVFAEEEQRLFGGERREQSRLDGIVAHDT